MGEGIVLGDSRGGKEARECAAQQDGDQRQGLFRATVALMSGRPDAEVNSE